MNEEARIKLTRARIALVIDQPFYGTLALRLHLVEDNTIPTLAVDGKSIFYNAKFVNELDDDLTRSGIAHEVGHCVFEHIARRNGRDPGKWNSAGDYVINDVLKESGFTLGPGWLWNAAYHGMSSDHIYSLLPDPPPGKKSPGPGQPGGPLCDIRDADVHQEEVSVDEWKLATIQAATVAKQAGKLPGALERFVKDLVNPKIDWRVQLRRFVTEVSKNDYSWQRPKKMMIPHGVYLPTLYSMDMGLLVCVIDTSGSITQKMLDVFGSEICAAHDAVKPQRLMVIYCDAAVNHVDTFLAEDVPVFKMHGGGGTDFRPPFEFLEKHFEKPAAFLYLTDMYGPFPDSPPDYPVMWCKTTPTEAPWGESIEVEV